jgi:hypothetical protein
MPVLHADQLPLSRKIGFNLREAGEVGLLTDASVAAANTVAGTRAAIRTAAPVHAEYEPYRERIVRAVDYGEASQELTDALIGPLTTVAGIVNLTDAVNFPPNRELMLD